MLEELGYKVIISNDFQKTYRKQLNDNDSRMISFYLSAQIVSVADYSGERRKAQKEQKGASEKEKAVIAAMKKTMGWQE